MSDVKPIGIKWSDIIKEAAKSPLGICALTVLAASVVAVYLFRSSPPTYQLGAFALLLIGIVGLACVTLMAKTQMKQMKSEVKSVTGDAIPDVPAKQRSAPTAEVPMVVRRLTVMDLTALKPGEKDAPPSEVLSKHTFTLKKTEESQKSFHHIASTSGDTLPKLDSDTHRFTVEKTGLSKDGKLQECRFDFDVSRDPVGEKFDLRYVLKFTGAFDRPDQQWAGIRVAQPTDMAVFRILFPAARPALTLNFYVLDTTDEHRIEVLAETLRIRKTPAEKGSGSSQVEWQIPRPKIDQRYCVSWEW